MPSILSKKQFNDAWTDTGVNWGAAKYEATIATLATALTGLWDEKHDEEQIEEISAAFKVLTQKGWIS